MRGFALFTVIFATAVCSRADSTNFLERFSPHFSTNTKILWRAPTEHLPKSLWIYKRLPPQPFSASVVSNAVLLASLPNEVFPKPSTNAFFIWSDLNPCGMRFDSFCIDPGRATISFCSTNQNLSTNDVADDKTVTRWALEYAARFGLKREDLVAENVHAVSNAVGRSETLTNGVCAHRILLARKINGVGFWSDGNNETEGFSIEFGGHGQIRSFSFVWPDLKPALKSLTASPREIIRCIREQSVLVLPDNQPNYFGRIKMLTKAKTFTVIKITPFYLDGVLGEIPPNDAPAKFVTPIAELKAVANFGNSNVAVRLLSPIITSEVDGLLKAE
jgi:hypothetical protein